MNLVFQQTSLILIYKDELDMPDINSSKNIWLAVSLAIITSVTSLGTAFISKDTSSNKETYDKLEALKEDFKELEKINQDLHGAIIIIKDKIKDCKCN